MSFDSNRSIWPGEDPAPITRPLTLAKAELANTRAPGTHQKNFKIKFFQTLKQHIRTNFNFSFQQPSHSSAKLAVQTETPNVDRRNPAPVPAGLASCRANLIPEAARDQSATAAAIGGEPPQSCRNILRTDHEQTCSTPSIASCYPPPLGNRSEQVAADGVARSRFAPTSDSENSTIRVFQVRKPATPLTPEPEKLTVRIFQVQKPDTPLTRAKPESVTNSGVSQKTFSITNISLQKKQKLFNIPSKPNNHCTPLATYRQTNHSITPSLQNLPYTPKIPAAPQQPTFRIFRVTNQGLPAGNHETPDPQRPGSPVDPRIDYTSRDQARRARRRATEDPLEAKLRAIFRSPEKASR